MYSLSHMKQKKMSMNSFGGYSNKKSKEITNFIIIDIIGYNWYTRLMILIIIMKKMILY